MNTDEHNATPEQQRVVRIVLTGTYNSANKGDAAMELTAMRVIADRFPNSRISMLSPFADMDAKFYHPVPVFQCNRRKLVIGTFELVRAALWRIFGVKALLSSTLRLVAESDLVVDLSGDMLTEDYGPHVAYSHYLPILRALILGRPYMLCAQSIGPFKLTRPMARMLLKRAVAISVRDTITLNYLRNLGIVGARVRQTADLAFLLEPELPQRVSEILHTQGIAIDDRPILGVSVSQLIESRYRSANTGHGKQVFADMIEEVVRQVARKYGAQVLFVAHVTGPGDNKDDRVIAQRIAASMAPDISCKVLAGDYRPEELKAIIARCRVFFGARMHANIAAISSLVPTVALSYSHKTPGIMQSCGMEDFVVPIESATVASLTALLDRAFDEHGQLVSLLEGRVAPMRARAMINFDVIADQLSALASTEMRA